jgi:hypothetical protein
MRQRTILPHTLARPPGLVYGERVLDIGAGIRPMGWYPASEHVCVEPFGPYAEILRAAGFEVIQETALDALHTLDDASFDAVYLLDVIEHMTREQGLAALEGACRVAARQVVVYTPDGFKAQDGDAWGLGGEHWQRHRSGWTAADFGAGWAVHPFTDEDGSRSLFAVWTRP